MEATAGKSCVQESTNIRILIKHKRQDVALSSFKSLGGKKMCLLKCRDVCVRMDLFMNERARA